MDSIFSCITCYQKKKQGSEIAITIEKSDPQTIKESESSNNLKLILLSETANIIPSPKFGSSISKVKHTCGPGTEISFGNCQTVKMQTYQKEEGIKRGINILRCILYGDLFGNQEIVIDQRGFHDGLRKKNDGHCYLGIVESLDKQSKPLNDIILPIGNYQMKPTESKSGRLFEIVYDLNELAFNIFVLHQHLHLTYFLTEDYYLTYGKEEEFHVGRAKVMINPKNKNKDFVVDISVSLDNTTSEYSFHYKNTPITIGRSNCLINIKDTSISKHHLTILLSSNNTFFIRDNGSTNITELWLREGDMIRAKSEMLLKVNDRMFELKLVLEL